MDKNVLYQILKRPLRGDKIKNIGFTCPKCPMMENSGYILQICEHFLNNSVSFLLQDILFEYCLTHCPDSIIQEDRKYYIIRECCDCIKCEKF